MSDQRSTLLHLFGDPEASLDSADAAVRRLAVVAVASRPSLYARIAAMLAADPDPGVRRECAESLGRVRGVDGATVRRALTDPAPEVREAAATAVGELTDRASLRALIGLADDDTEDALVREAAVAALGAIGDTRALPVLLQLIAAGPPQVRRRCVAALTVFDGDEVEAALRRAAGDRNPMVREAAEMVVGRSVD